MRQRASAGASFTYGWPGPIGLSIRITHQQLCTTKYKPRSQLCTLSLEGLPFSFLLKTVFGENIFWALLLKIFDF